jgi:alpha-ribazole phosphatase
VLLVRHGETQWNRDLKVQGHLDILLSETGRDQAKLLARRLASWKIGAVYSSDLARARETAEIIAGHHHLPVTAVRGLREGSFGAWEGLSLAEIREQFAENYSAYRENPVTTQPQDGESCSEVAFRAQAAVNEIARAHPGETVLIVSHGGTLKTILCGFLELDLSRRWHFAVDNCGISCIEYQERGPVVLFMNDTAHLRDAAVEAVEG